MLKPEYTYPPKFQNPEKSVKMRNYTPKVKHGSAPLPTIISYQQIYFNRMLLITNYFYDNYTYSIINYYGIAFTFTLLWLKFIYIKNYFRHNRVTYSIKYVQNIIYITHLDSVTLLYSILSFCVLLIFLLYYVALRAQAITESEGLRDSVYL